MVTGFSSSSTSGHLVCGGKHGGNFEENFHLSFTIVAILECLRSLAISAAIYAYAVPSILDGNPGKSVARRLLWRSG